VTLNTNTLHNLIQIYIVNTIITEKTFCALSSILIEKFLLKVHNKYML